VLLYIFVFSFSLGLCVTVERLDVT